MEIENPFESGVENTTQIISSEHFFEDQQALQRCEVKESSYNNSRNSKNNAYSQFVISDCNQNNTKRVVESTTRQNQLNGQMKYDIIRSQRKNTKKKPLQNEQISQKQVSTVYVMKKLNPEIITLSPGLTITDEGVLRFCFTVGYVTFGMSCHSTNSVSYDKQNEIISICSSNPSPSPQVSIERAIDFVQRTQCKRFNEISNALHQYSSFQNQIFNLFQSTPITESSLLQKDQEMQEYLQSSLEFIAEYTKKNEGSMFSFSIGRVNLGKGNIEVMKTGYSKSLIDLLGLDVETFITLLLRQYQIDLIEDPDEIVKQSIIGLNHKLLSIEGLDLTYKINTFDGFPLNLHSSKRQFQPKQRYNPLIDFPSEYVLSIHTVDVDLHELQNLILYRQKLRQSSDSLSYDDFVRKELSFRFEEVEYSVHSKSFLEKFYQENLQVLYYLEQRCQQKQPDIRKECGIRPIHKIHSANPNPIQVIYAK